MSDRTRHARRQDRALSRRGFLMTALGGGIAFGLSHHANAEIILPRPSGPTDDIPVFDSGLWCSIAGDGTVSINIVRAEIGQHVGSALARILADELEADWDTVRIVYVDTEKRFGERYVTGGSWSVWETWDMFRQAGAAARTILVEEAAHLLKTSPSRCKARNGVVSTGTHSLSYGEIVTHARPTRQMTPEDMAALPLKPAREYRLIGRDMPALDIPDKTTGKALYGIDVQWEGMLYARPKLPPTRFGAKVVTVDDKACHTIKGYERYIVLDDPSGHVQGMVVVVARSWHAAMRAADRLKVEWSPAPAWDVSEDDLLAHARALEADPKKGIDLYNDNGVDDAFKTKEQQILTQSYTSASVAHFTLEPVNALARKVGDIWEIHAGNQWQSLALPQLAKALKVDEDHVVLRTYLIGGGFGRRLGYDYLIPAALTSQALDGAPVKLLFTRSDDMAFDTIRSPSLQTISAVLDNSRKTLGAMRYNVTAGWPTLAAAPAILPKGLNGVYDLFAVYGADHWYEVGPFHLRAICNDLANRTFWPGWLRSVGAGWTPWALESFIDEAAHAMQVDPVAFRLGMLTTEGRNAGSSPNSTGGASRQAAVLKRLAEKIDWNTINHSLPADTGIGIATTFGQERGMPTWTAGAAQVYINRETGLVTCQKLWLVLDAGIIVDPNGAHAQVEGGALWGLSMALFEGTEIVHGSIKDRNLNTYTPLRLADVPEVDIEFVPSAEKPMGLGEPGVTVIAPAIGNAIYNTLGIRLRHIPIRPQAVLAALHAQKQTALTDKEIKKGP